MAFDLQPNLQGELIKLRPLREEDFHGLYAVASDPKIWEQHPDSDRCREDVFQGFFRDAMDSRGALTAFDMKNQQTIGSSRYHAYDQSKRVVEIGWTFLARSHWGGSYNREMKRLMLQHAFKYVERVNFVIGEKNIRSQRAIEKIGASYLETRSDDLGRDHFVYQITPKTSKA